MVRVGKECLVGNSMVRSTPLEQEETSHALVMKPRGSHGEEQPWLWVLCDLPCAHVGGGAGALQTGHAVHGGAGGWCGGQR